MSFQHKENKLKTSFIKDKEKSLEELASTIQVCANWHDRELVRRNIDLEMEKIILSTHIQKHLEHIQNQAITIATIQTMLDDNTSQTITEKDLEISILNAEVKKLNEFLTAEQKANKEHLNTVQESYKLRLELQNERDSLLFQIEKLKFEKNKELKEQKNLYENQIKDLGIPVWFQRTSAFLGIQSPSRVIAKAFYLSTLIILLGTIFLLLRPLKWMFKQAKKFFKNEEKEK